MKLQPDRLQDVNVITAYDRQCFSVNGSPHQQSLWIPHQGPLLPWACSKFEDLSAADFEGMAALGPELIILGTGPKLQFARPALTAALMQRRIGLECMDTQAACRTYNILVTEGRSVMAALILGGQN